MNQKPNKVSVQQACFSFVGLVGCSLEAVSLFNQVGGVLTSMVSLSYKGLAGWSSLSFYLLVVFSVSWKYQWSVVSNKNPLFVCLVDDDKGE